MLPALAPAALSWKNRGLIAWFGPRGLSTLLLVLLPVFAGIEGSYDLLQICCLVVMVSVVLHGFSPMVLLRGKAEARAPLPLRVIAKTPSDAQRADDHHGRRISRAEAIRRAGRAGRQPHRSNL